MVEKRPRSSVAQASKPTSDRLIGLAFVLVLLLALASSVVAPLRAEAITGADVVSVAKAQVGKKGSTYQSYCGLGSSQPWCQAFTSWCFNQAGAGTLIKKTASCYDAANWFRSNARWKSVSSGYTPQAGDVGYFFTSQSSDGKEHHVGIVTGYDGVYVHMVEGNYIVGSETSATSSVHETKRRLNGASSSGTRLVGFGIPAYNGTAIIPPSSNNNDPVGCIDSISGKNGVVTLSGWVFDPNSSSTSTSIHVYAGTSGPETFVGSLSANLARADVNKAYSITGNHGFSGSLNAPFTDSKTLYIYGINIGAGGNKLLGTRSVNVGSGNPVGCFDSASGGVGNVTVRGWAFDPNATSSTIPVHVYIGGPAGSGECHVISANTSRSDVNTAYGISGNHGFQATISTSKTGSQKVYIYAINAGAGTDNPLIGSKTVTISADSAGPKISDFRIENITPDGYDVSCVASDSNGISKVQFPTWSEYNGQDDLVWHNASLSNGRYTYHVKITDHASNRGFYSTHVYAWDKAGNSAMLPSSDILVPQEEVSYNGSRYYLADMKYFTSSYTYSEIVRRATSNGYLKPRLQLAKIGDVKTLNYLASWVKGYTASGKTEYWIGAAPDKGEAKYLSLNCNTRAVTTLTNSGGSIGCANMGFIYEDPNDDRILPTISDVCISDVDEEGYTVTCKAYDYSGVTRVVNATWTGEDTASMSELLAKPTLRQDEVKVGEDGVVTFRVLAKDYKESRGKYQTHIWAWDPSGNRAEACVNKTTNRDLLLPASSTLLDSNLYYRFDVTASWTQADAYAKALGGHLASISDQTENKAIHSLISDNPASKIGYWLGAKRTGGMNDFSWVDDSKFSFTNWNTGEPNNDGGSENYVGIRLADGKWNDYPNAGAKSSSDNMGFIVEFDNEASEGGDADIIDAYVSTSPTELGQKTQFACEVLGTEKAVKSYSWQCSTSSNNWTTLDNSANTLSVTPTEDMAKCYAYRCIVTLEDGTEITSNEQGFNIVGHDLVQVEGTKATCAEEGHREYWECTRCSEIFSDINAESTINRTDTVIAATGHEIENWTTAAEPSCTKEGTKSGTCSTCKKTITESIPAKGHSVSNGSPVAPTCTTPGRTSAGICTDCGAEVTAGQTIPATGHKWELSKTVKATCKQAGSISYVCANNSTHVRTETEPVLAHALAKVSFQAATCTEIGTIEHYKCKTCGGLFADTLASTATSTDAVTIKAAGHRLESVSEEASCGKPGFSYSVCSVCGHKENERSTPALTHSWVEGTKTDATCQNPGMMMSYCENCNQWKIDNVPALGHDFQLVSSIEGGCAGKTDTYKCKTCSFTKVEETEANHSLVKVKALAETCTTNGNITYFECEKCGGLFTDSAASEPITEAETIIPAQGHVEVIDSAVEATCTKAGSTKGISCRNCGTTIAEKRTIPASGHTWGNWMNVKETTCSEDGFRIRICDTCATSETEGMTSKGHSWESDFTVDREPTYMADGSESIHCANCDATKDSRTIPVLPKTMLSDCEVNLDATSYTYNGSVRKPTVAVTLDGETVSDEFYMVTYPSDCKNVGTYEVTVAAKNGNCPFGGSVILTFEINPVKTSITGLTKGKKRFTAKWSKKTTQVTGYQLQYATSSKFSGAKTATVTSYKTMSKTVKGLKAKKKYYVRIRTYKTVDGVRHYSNWSASKSVTTR